MEVDDNYMQEQEKISMLNIILREENKTILREKIKEFLKFKEPQTKQDAELMPKERYEIYTTELNKEKEEQARLEFYNSLSKIEDNKQTILLEQRFFLLKEYTKMVCKGNATGLIVEGQTGLGKSYNILKALKESGKEFVYCSGFTTELQLYNFLFENHNKIIYFDDSKNIFSSEKSLELLKSALFSATGTRIIRYSSSSPLMKYPHEFIFSGGLIISVNSLSNKNDEDMRAVIDRVLYFKVEFNYFEKLSILADLVKQDYKELNEEERKFIYEFIKKNTNKSTINLNFRLLYKLFEIYRYSKENFELLAKSLIQNDDRIELILTCLNNNDSVKKAELEFIEKTGFSGRYFYKLKARIE